MKIAAWVRTADSVGFPYTRMPAYTVIPMLPCLVYMRYSTLIIALLSTLFVWRMTAKGMTMKWLLNRLKGKMRGNRQSARPVWHIRRFCHLSDPTVD